MPQAWLQALIGGAVIGVAVSCLLLFNGRVAGISGIISGLLPTKSNSNAAGDRLWRLLFILGMVAGGFVLFSFNADVFSDSLTTTFNTVETMMVTTVSAGLLVGFGTHMGGGCTSGHGVCGISRMSMRSLLATLIFIAAGVATVALVRSQL